MNVMIDTIYNAIKQIKRDEGWRGGEQSRAGGRAEEKRAEEEKMW